MKHCVVVDVETTGLEPCLHQLTEASLIRVVDGIIGEEIHFYVSHKTYVIPEFNLKNFKSPLARQEGVPIYPMIDVNKVVTNFMKPFGRTTFVGKNCSFDYGFLEKGCPELRHMVGHRRLDVGNLYTAFDDVLVPGLDECVRRAVLCGVPGLTLEDAKIQHTARADCLTTAKLYLGWYNGQLGSPNSPAWRRSVPDHRI